MNLSEEQQNFINAALMGKNILVNACIGSGKTTAIQQLCNMFPENKKILYLTYNRLLKLDAQNKITSKNTTVQNYHGFAAKALLSEGVKVGVSEQIQAFLLIKTAIPHYDVLILDEYQDIMQEIADELLYIKSQCPGIQIIAVGDMCQKVYDFTTLTDIDKFIHELLDGPVEIQFTKCFRLPNEYADKLGKIWGKTINGVNKDCTVEKLDFHDAVKFLGTCKPGDVLVLGANKGARARLQNEVEHDFPDLYNKKTLWASITKEGTSKATSPKEGSAIFTTFDASKGMERPICVLCDFDIDYWKTRSKNPQTKYDVLRNIFLVAASRGKNKIIFVQSNSDLLTEHILSTRFETNHSYSKPINISEAFDFKYKEDVEACFSMLHIKKVQNVSKEIKAKLSDGLIDLSPCIGEYVEASYFKNYDADEVVRFLEQFYDRSVGLCQEDDIQHKILMLTYLATGQQRYLKQVYCPYVNQETTDQIHERLNTRFTGDEEEQIEGEISFTYKEGGAETLTLKGRCDVLKDENIYELKFVNELQHAHFLQLACYLVMLKKRIGYLWNIRNDEMYLVTIPDVALFMDQVARTITKRDYPKYYTPVESRYFAVIDTETNSDIGATGFGQIGSVMSIGVIISDAADYRKVDQYYGIIADEAKKPAWLQARTGLRLPEVKIDAEDDRTKILCDVNNILSKYHINTIAAYNAKFDKSCLPELQKEYTWIDIMGPCAYRQYNPYLPAYLKTHATGKVSSGYKVDDLLRYIRDPSHISEKHNALLDANDELFIMSKLNLPLSLYRNFPTSAQLRKSAVPFNEKAEKERKQKLEQLSAKLTDEDLNSLSDDFNVNHAETQRVVLYGWVENIHRDQYRLNLEFSLHTKNGECNVSCRSRSGDMELHEDQIVVVEGMLEPHSRTVNCSMISSPEEYKQYYAFVSGMRDVTGSNELKQCTVLEGSVKSISNKSCRFIIYNDDEYVSCYLVISDSELKKEALKILYSGKPVCVRGRLMQYVQPKEFMVFSVSDAKNTSK